MLILFQDLSVKVLLIMIIGKTIKKVLKYFQVKTFFLRKTKLVKQSVQLAIIIGKRGVVYCL